MEGCEGSLADLLGRPAADVSTAMQEDFEQTDDAHVVDFDAGIAQAPMVIGKAMRCSSGKSA